MAQHNTIGALGEQIARKYLKNKGFSFVEANYRKKWGEIDIVMQKQNSIHFIEVKTISRENISEEYIHNHRPEENVHIQKQRRLGRTIETYVSEKGIGEWELHIVSVFLDPARKRACIRVLWDV